MADKASIHPRGSHVDQTGNAESRYSHCAGTADNIADRSRVGTAGFIETNNFATIFRLCPDRGFIRDADSR
jgi:hypothetical protein